MSFSSVSAFAAKIDVADFSEEEHIRRHNRFIGLRMNSGTVLVTDDFIRAFESRYYHSLSARFGFRPTSSSRTGSYAGLGLHVVDFPTGRDIFGNPITAYMFHGGTVRDFSTRFSVHYEWNLGASFNWRHYCSVNSPENVLISTPVNAYASINAYARWQLSPRIDLNVGGDSGIFPTVLSDCRIEE